DDPQRRQSRPRAGAWRGDQTRPLCARQVHARRRPLKDDQAPARERDASLSRAMLERFVSSFFKSGRMLVRLPGGRAISIGAATEETAPLIVRVKSQRALLRIALKPTLHTGEAYMGGDLVIERGDLYDFLLLATANLRHYKPLPLPFANWRRR